MFASSSFLYLWSLNPMRLISTGESCYASTQLTSPLGSKNLLSAGQTGHLYFCERCLKHKHQGYSFSLWHNVLAPWQGFPFRNEDKALTLSPSTKTQPDIRAGADSCTLSGFSPGRMSQVISADFLHVLSAFTEAHPNKGLKGLCLSLININKSTQTTPGLLINNRLVGL